jgi:tRNA U55 pseudouridine synthase TruB
VALEKRDGYLYYYRSVRDGEKVRKVYVGAGDLARIASESDTLRRTDQKATREREKAELEHLDTLAAPVLELSEAAEVLVRAHLIASGCHRHKGEWRRARGDARSA